MRLFKRAGLLVLLMLAFASFAQAQRDDLAGIIKQHLDSRGGYDRVSGLQRYEMIGTVTRMGQTLPLHVWWRYPNRLRVDVGKGEGATSSVYDGKMAWTVESGPWGKEPTGMVPGWRELFVRQADFGGPFLNPEKRGLHITNDNSTWSPTAGYRFYVKRETGQTDEVFLDPNTRLAKTEIFQVGPSGFEYRVEQRYSRYRRTEGFALPSKIERFVDGQPLEVINIDQVIIGPPVAEELFVVKGADYSGSESPNLVDLNSLSDLRDRFRSDAGRTRLVAVLSPTSADSRRGFLDLQNALNRINDDRVRAYVIWTKVLETDQRAAAAKRAAEYQDPRIAFFWDQNHLAAGGWESVSNSKRTSWNSYFLHGPKASWESAPSAPDFWFQSGDGISSAADADGFTKMSTLLTSMPDDDAPGGKSGK